jgi:hypothetical protein
MSTIRSCSTFTNPIGPGENVKYLSTITPFHFRVSHIHSIQLLVSFHNLHMNTKYILPFLSREVVDLEA